ncbi:hypothetical protein [Clostridium thailandense]|uniref:hypothetical protein n=1 Tax=Clostridium thailandense TaxID=2794346 RepID=UPI003988F876
MNSIKGKSCLFFCFFFLYLCFPIYSNVQASEVNSNIYNAAIKLPEESNISVKNSWSITLPESITIDKLDGLVVEKNSQNIPVLVSTLNNKTLSIRPIEPYEENSTYTAKIFLNDNEEYILDFTTEILTYDNIQLEYTPLPQVSDVNIIDDETIRIKFNQNMKHIFAENLSNYQLKDKDYNNISNHIKAIIPVTAKSNTDTNTYDIVLYKTAGDAKTNGMLTKDVDSTSWNLIQNQYNITIENIPSIRGVVMYKYSFGVGATDAKK